MTSSIMPFNVKKKLREEAEYQSQSKCPRFDCEEAPDRHFQVKKKSFFIKDPGAHWAIPENIPPPPPPPMDDIGHPVINAR